MPDLDERLRRDGASWRTVVGNAPRTASVAGSAAPAQKRRSTVTRFAPLAAAAAVLLTVAGLYLATAHNSDSPTGFGSLTQAPAGPPTAPATPDKKAALRADIAANLGPAVPVRVIQPSATAHLISMPWRYVGPTKNQGALDIVYVAGDNSCTESVGVEVIESSASVELLALSRHVPATKPATKPPATNVCLTRLVLRHALVPLARPLGSRTLLHGPTDPAWSDSFPPGLLTR